MPPAPGDRAAHWNNVYQARPPSALTWHEDAPETTLDLLGARLSPGDPVIDVGAGASRLTEALAARGFGPLTALDVSAAALETSRARLGAAADAVTWIEADVTEWRPETRYALWHDRAVFHFLTDAADRAAYVRALERALRPGGVAVIATFADDGPEMCSGLPVARYAPETLAAEIARHAPGVFRLAEARRRVHVTPKGAEQRFQHALFERAEPDPA